MAGYIIGSLQEDCAWDGGEPCQTVAQLFM